MRNISLKLTQLMAIGVLTLFACKKESQNVTPVIVTQPGTNTDHFGESMVTSSIGGIITDDNNNPVASATVSVGANSVTTDVNGVFLLNDIQVNEKRTFIKVNKTGYFFGSRAIYPTANSVSYVNIELLSANSVGSFSSASGGTINAGGVELSFPANAVKIEGGGIYAGTVNVAAKFLDPTSDEFEAQMPGDLMAINSSDQLRVLETYGMAAVELTSPSGQKLNVADGKKVELTVSLSGAYLTDAPSSIPLWYFSETEGIWIEEGSANKVGNEYVGEVSHFSFWNCDNPNPSTTIVGSVMCGSDSLANAKVSITNPAGRILGYAYTNSSGVFSGFIPTNTTLVLKIFSGSCGTTPIYTSTIGPFTAPVTLPVITACTGASMQGSFSATLLDCSGSPISNGVLEVNLGGRKSYLFPNSSGVISTNLVYCTYSSFDIQAFDYANSMQSSVQTVSSSATMNMGNITVCGAIDEYITYTLDGTNYRIDKIPGNYVSQYTWGGSTNIYGRNSSGTNTLTGNIQGAAIGTFAMQPDSGAFVNNLYATVANTSVNATFTNFGTTSGSYKTGTFVGSFIDNSSVSHTLNGSFRFKIP